MFPEGIGAHDSHKKASIHAGLRGFAALVVGQIKAALDKRRPQSDPQAQGEWKKTPRNACRNPQRPGARQNHQADISRRGALWAHLWRTPIWIRNEIRPTIWSWTGLARAALSLPEPGYAGPRAQSATWTARWVVLCRSRAQAHPKASS